jgi:hypothetical protein
MDAPEDGRTVLSSAPSLLQGSGFGMGLSFLQFPLARGIANPPGKDGMLSGSAFLKLFFPHKVQRTADTMLHARRLEPCLRSSPAQVAMAGRAYHLVERDAAVRAAVNAEPAAAASLFVDENEPVVAFEDGPARTQGLAEGIIAVPAHQGDKIQVELSFNPPRAHRHHPAPGGPCFRREVVLLPTRDLARIASHTAVNIDEEHLLV